MSELEVADLDGFVNRLNREYLWYRNEVIQLLKDFGLSLYVEHIIGVGMYRWYPSEVLDLMSIVDQSMDPSIPKVDACEKHIPDFLLKVNQ